MNEDKTKTIARIGINDKGRIVVKYWINDGIELPSANLMKALDGTPPSVPVSLEVSAGFDLVIQEKGNGLFLLKLDKKPPVALC
jgi:hypothetical protein